MIDVHLFVAVTIIISYLFSRYFSKINEFGITYEEKVIINTE